MWLLFATGVVISLVSDDNGGGFVIVLNGSDFTELARADLPYGLPYGLHGCWVPGQVPQIWFYQEHWLTNSQIQKITQPL
jgi:hypothetical protein